MERVYFSINEAGAKTANDMMSFGEYKTGSKTAGYKAQVDKAYELAEKEDTDAMRVQLFFEDKPEPEVRDVLKHNGFRWAPSVGAWQRHLNANGKSAVRSVIRELEEMEAKE